MPSERCWKKADASSVDDVMCSYEALYEVYGKRSDDRANQALEKQGCTRKGSGTVHSRSAPFLFARQAEASDAMMDAVSPARPSNPLESGDHIQRGGRVDP